MNSSKLPTTLGLKTHVGPTSKLTSSDTPRVMALMKAVAPTKTANVIARRIIFRASRYFRKKAQRGQAMTEYLILVALVAVSTLGVAQLFGQSR